MTDKLITIAEFADSIKANLAKQKLEDLGLKVFLAEERTGEIFGIAAIATIKLQVQEDKAERALEILKSEMEG